MFTLLLACTSGGPDDSGAPTTDDSGSTDTAVREDVARVQLPAGLLTSTGEGTYAMSDGTEIYELGKAFYGSYPDTFDFLLLYTDFLVDDLFAFSVPLDHSIEGIGQQEVMALYGWSDLSPATAGSTGALGQVVLMNGPERYSAGARWGAEDVLLHEVGHRWSANLSLDAADAWILTDTWYSHWSVMANVGGPSAEGYGTLEDRGDTFEYVLSDDLVYSDLELYQQGLMSAEEVGEMFYVAPSDFAGSKDAVAQAVTFSGTRVDFTVDDIVARHGPRVPSSAEAQTHFRVAFALVCEDVEACDEDAFEWVEGQRLAFEQSYATATRGRGSVSTELWTR